MVPEQIFKAYDIRGIYPEEISEDGAYRIAQAYAKMFNPAAIVLGRDVRVSGPSLFEAMARGFTDHGVNVIDIGVVTTDMMYFAAANYPVDGGVTISASHNPKEYNGFKLVRAGAVPVSGDTGINDIRKLVTDGYRYTAPKKGGIEKKDITKDYLKKCLSFVEVNEIKPLRVVANAMFGPALQNVMKAKLPVLLMMLNETPDGTFPKGQPDPLQEKNQAETVALIKEKKPDLGVAWDADADRFFLFDENGRNIPGYYITAFLGKSFAEKVPGAKIIHDPRVTWAVEDEVKAAGGVPLINKVGHSFIKERMRKEDAIFAGEMSGHYYFRDFYFCDNGLIPFLMILEIVSKSGKKVSELFNHYFEKYPISGEINMKLKEGEKLSDVLARIEKKHGDAKMQKVDGLSIEYPTWRANVRGSNTEPLVRLNLEARDRITLERELPALKSLVSGS